MGRLKALLGGVALLTVSAATAADRSMMAIPGDPVATTGGRIAGTLLASGVRAYLGIPFAEPPVGPLRWVAPRPIRWGGVWNADRKGPECIQVLRPHDLNHYFGEEPSSEDCLYANVWTPPPGAPAGEGAGRPVVVFIYGGGYTIGSSGMANYDGEAMAKSGAVFVNFNYRVGAFGYLAHPALTREQGGHSGNYGLMDQVAALRWVHDNIARFGGDPAKVLVMGQSAGAGSVASLIFSPLARGLFRAGAMSSGCNFETDGPTLAQAEATGLQLQQRLGAADLAALRQLPADRILAAQSESQVGAHVEGVRIGGPIIDGYALPQTKAAALAARAVNAVPIIAGYNGADLAIGYDPLIAARTVAEYQAAAQRLFGADAAAFLKLYPARTDADVGATARRAAMEGGMERNARFCVRAQASLGQPAYLYNYVRVHPYTPGVHFSDQNPATAGAYHTADIPYWFGTQDKYNMYRPTRNWTAWDRTLSSRMMGALIAAAATGNPSTPAMPWPAAPAGRERKLVLGDTISVVPLDQARIDWMAAHPVARTAPVPTGNPRD